MKTETEIKAESKYKQKVTLLYYPPAPQKGIGCSGGHAAVLIEHPGRQGTYPPGLWQVFDFPGNEENPSMIEQIYGKAIKYELPPPGKELDPLKSFEESRKNYKLLSYNCSTAAAKFLQETLGYKKIFESQYVTTPGGLKDLVEYSYSLQTKLDKIFEFKAITPSGKKRWDAFKNEVKQIFKIEEKSLGKKPKLPSDFQNIFDWNSIREQVKKLMATHQKHQITLFTTQRDSIRYQKLSEVLAVVNLYCEPEKDVEVAKEIDAIEKIVKTSFFF